MIMRQLLHLLIILIDMVTAVLVIYVIPREITKILDPADESVKRLAHQKADYFCFTTLIWLAFYLVYCLLASYWSGMSEFTDCMLQTSLLVLGGWSISKYWDFERRETDGELFNSEELSLISMVSLINATLITSAAGMTNLLAITIFAIGLLFSPDPYSWNVTKRLKNYLSGINTKYLIIDSVFCLISFISTAIYTVISGYTINQNWRFTISYMSFSCLIAIIVLLFGALFPKKVRILRDCIQQKIEDFLN